MSHAHRIYHRWLTSPYIDEQTKEELLAIRNSPEEIEQRFSGNLAFGTGGVRGLLGAGTKRINRYTVRRLAQGLADYLAESEDGSVAKQGVVIAYDTRDQSKELALEAACTLISNDIPAFVFQSPRPTPLLSFAVRDRNALAGIVITASHNPPNYNGFKVYGPDGAQIVPSLANRIKEKVDSIVDLEDLSFVESTSRKKNDKLFWIGASVDQKYIHRVLALRPHVPVDESIRKELSIVYSPLHGTGSAIVPELLCQAGFARVAVVSEQEQADPAFSTVEVPNPELSSSYDLAIQRALQLGAELILVTDPDSDRVGAAYRNRSGEYTILTGNQIGVLLLHYILTVRRKMGDWPNYPVMVKTIVTSEMGRVIAEQFGVKTINTLTGFKYIGEQIRLLEQTGTGTFLCGYEESNGFLYGTLVRDKDGVQATLFICEMVAYYKQRGMNLSDVLEQLYQTYGYYAETLETRTISKTETITWMLKQWREDPPVEVGSYSVVEVSDYLERRRRNLLDGSNDRLSLPSENTLFYRLEDGSWFCIRPSGTEPKVKVYFSVKGDNQSVVQRKRQTIVNEVMNRIDSELCR